MTTAYVTWLALEVAEGIGGQALLDLLLTAQLEDLKDRGILTDYGIVTRPVKPGERPPALPLDGLLPKLGKA